MVQVASGDESKHQFYAASHSPQNLTFLCLTAFHAASAFHERGAAAVVTARRLLSPDLKRKHSPLARLCLHRFQEQWPKSATACPISVTATHALRKIERLNLISVSPLTKC